MKRRLRNALIIVSITGISACNKKDIYTTASINDYLPLQPGHSYTYQLDSTVFTNFGTMPEVHSYIAKDSIADTFTDNSGRLSYRVVRYYCDANDSAIWHPNTTYFITPLANTIELVENNLRFVKLGMPIQDINSWSGNGYLPFKPYSDKFDFDNTDHTQLNMWNYIYQDPGKPATINNRVFDNTLTVVCSSPDSTNFPPVNPIKAGNKTVWIEQYAKGVGLIYRDIIFEEYQMANLVVSNPYFTGFELRMSIIKYQ